MERLSMANKFILFIQVYLAEFIFVVSLSLASIHLLLSCVGVVVSIVVNISKYYKKDKKDDRDTEN